MDLGCLFNIVGSPSTSSKPAGSMNTLPSSIPLVFLVLSSCHLFPTLSLKCLYCCSLACHWLSSFSFPESRREDKFASDFLACDLVFPDKSTDSGSTDKSERVVESPIDAYQYLLPFHHGYHPLGSPQARRSTHTPNADDGGPQCLIIISSIFGSRCEDGGCSQSYPEYYGPTSAIVKSTESEHQRPRHKRGNVDLQLCDDGAGSRLPCKRRR